MMLGYRVNKIEITVIVPIINPVMILKMVSFVSCFMSSCIYNKRKSVNLLIINDLSRFF